MSYLSSELPTQRETARDLAVVQVDGAFTVRPIRALDRALARLLAFRLDGELAAGRAPEQRWLRAVRATMLMSPHARRRLAADWEHVLARPRRAATMPVRVTQSDGTRDLVTQLVEKLSANAPVGVRGLASAAVLLADGSGPLYRPQSPEHLPAALTAAIAQLTP